MKKLFADFAKTHLVIIAAFLALSIVYFSPALEGKVLNQSDMVHASGMSQELIEYHEETGEYAQWTNAMFGGMPAFHMGPHGKKTTVFGYIGMILRFGMGYSNPIAIFFMYLLGFYALLLSVRLKPWQAMIGVRPSWAARWAVRPAP